MYKSLSARGRTAEGNLDMRVFKRWVARWVGPEHVHGGADEFGLVLETCRLSEAGYLVSVFRAYGGWCHWQFQALCDLVARRQAAPAFDGLGFVVLRDCTGFTAPDELLRSEFVGTTQGVSL